MGFAEGYGWLVGGLASVVVGTACTFAVRNLLASLLLGALIMLLGACGFGYALGAGAAAEKWAAHAGRFDVAVCRAEAHMEPAAAAAARDACFKARRDWAAAAPDARASEWLYLAGVLLFFGGAVLFQYRIGKKLQLILERLGFKAVLLDDSVGRRTNRRRDHPAKDGEK